LTLVDLDPVDDADELLDQLFLSDIGVLAEAVAAPAVAAVDVFEQ
jgi:hypothetical protein